MTSPRPERPRVPIITVGLRPHPTSPDAGAPGAGPVGRLLATMFAPPEGGAVFEFRLEDSRLGKLAIPASVPEAQRSGTVDGLWQHTCCEAFIAGKDCSAYREYNFSPSGQWACYRFTGYRQRDPAFTASSRPPIVLRPEADGFQLDATLPADLLPASQTLVIGLSVVIEAADGSKSYWALAHGASQPDFHLRQSFALTLHRTTT